MAREDALPDKQSEVDQIALALKAISHPTRLKILCFLSEQEKIINEILDYVGTTQSNISQHIDILRKAGVVQSRRSHNKVYCSLQDDGMLPLVSQIKGVFCGGKQENRGSNPGWKFI